MDNLDRRLKKIFDLIRDEARQNPAFAERLSVALGSIKAPERSGASVLRVQRDVEPGPSSSSSEPKRGNRRAPALLDPIATIKGGDEARLRDGLEPLNLEQLRDVVAEYRMDPNKLVMKWKDRERVIEHIVVTAVSRERKGDAFRA